MKRNNIFSRSHSWANFIGLILNIIFFGLTLYCGYLMMLYWSETSHGFWLFVGFFLATSIMQGVLVGFCKWLVNNLFPVMTLERARETLTKSNASFFRALWKINKSIIKLDKYGDDFDPDKYLEKLKRSKIQSKLIEKLGTRINNDFYTDEQLFKLLDNLDTMILREYDTLMNSNEMIIFKDPDLEIFVVEGIKKLKEEGKL